MEELLEATKGGKRVRKTPQEKLAILAFLDAGGSPEDAVARFGIARNAVAKMLKEREDAAPEAAAAATSMLGKRAREAPTNEELAAFAQQPGVSVAAAAAKFGLTRAEVARALKEIAEDASSQPQAAAAALALVSTDVFGADSVANASLAAEQIAAVNGLAGAPLMLSATEGIEGVTPVSSELTGLTDRLAAVDSSHTVKADGRKTVRMTTEQKAAILQFVEQGGLPATAAEKFGVSLTAVAKAIQEKANALVAITAAMTSTAVATGDLQIATASAITTTAIPTTTVMTSDVESNIMDVESAASATASHAATSSTMEIDTGAAAAVVNGSSTAMSATVTTSIASTISTSASSADATMSVVSTAAAPSEAAATIASATDAIAAPVAETTTAKTDSTVPAMPAPTNTGARKGRRVRKTNSEKLEILAFVEKGGSQGAAAEKFGVSRTAVTKMVKEKDAICAQARSENTNSRKVLQYQHKLSIIEDMLYKWQLQVEIDSPSVKLTGDLLQSKAMEFRNKVLADYSSELPDEVVLSLTDFKASNGWLHRYMQRRSIRALPKHSDEGTAAASAAGTSASGDRASAEQRIHRIRAQLTQVPASCIWTLSEVVLRHRTTSGRLDALINLDTRAMDRVSVALAASASGEKLRLQVVAKDEHAAALLGGGGADAIDPVATYGIQFRTHTRAWHDSYAVMEYIQQMNREAKARKQVWFLVLDSSASHVAAAHALHPAGSYRTGFTFESMVLLFLPPSASVTPTTGSNNTVRDIQPLCQGVVRVLKRTFRFEMLQSLVNARRAWLERTASHQTSGDSTGNSTGGELFDIHAHTTIRHSLLWLQKAWAAVTPSEIRRAWSSCAFLPPQSDDKASDGAASTAANGDSAAENGQASTSGSISVSTTGSIASVGQLRELLSSAAVIPQLVKDLGLDGLTDADNDEAFEAEVADFDRGDSGAADELAKDDEIVIESLSLQGLLRDTPRALDDIAKDSASANAGPEIASVGEACGTVARLLRFIMARGGSTTAQELLAPSDRRAARANLLALQRVLLKARTKEQEQEQEQDQAHEQEHDATTAYTV